MAGSARRSSILLAAFALASAVPAFAGAGHGVPSRGAAFQEGMSEAQRFTEAQRLRRELHLRSDPAYLLDLSERFLRDDASVSDNRGILMDPAEVTDLDDREAKAVEIAATAREHFASASADFGGVYIDHADGSTVVLVVNDIASHEAELRRKVSDPSRLRVERAAFPLAALDALSSRVLADSAALARGGAAISGITVLERENVVEVALAQDTPEARELLQNRYPNAGLRVTGPVSNSRDGVTS